MVLINGKKVAMPWTEKPDIVALKPTSWPIIRSTDILRTKSTAIFPFSERLNGWFETAFDSPTDTAVERSQEGAVFLLKTLLPHTLPLSAPTSLILSPFDPKQWSALEHCADPQQITQLN